MKLPAIPGMEEFAGHSFHTARWDYGYTGGGPGEPLTDLADKGVALIGNGASGIQCVPPLAESAKHVYLFQRTPSAIGERGNRPTDPSFAHARAGLAAGAHGQLPGDHHGPARRRRPGRRRVDPRLRRQPSPPAGGGHDHGGVHAGRRGGRLPDHGGPPAPGRRARGRPGQGRDREALLPVPLQAAVLPRRVPAGPQPCQPHHRRLPGRGRAGHRAGPGGRRPAVRGRLHHLRHRLRGGGHADLPAGRPRDRRPRRHHPGREVGRRRRQPVRDDEPWVPQHVHHAGDRASRRW